MDYADDRSQDSRHDRHEGLHHVRRCCRVCATRHVLCKRVLEYMCCYWKLNWTMNVRRSDLHAGNADVRREGSRCDHHASQLCDRMMNCAHEYVPNAFYSSSLILKPNRMLM
jgi:hypothetical protein